MNRFYFLPTILLSVVAQAADVAISDLTAITNPSTNTWIEVADIAATPKSRKYLLTDLSIWTNNSGVITPSGVSGMSNTLTFVSGLTNSETNIAFVVNTKGPWADGRLATFSNNSTNKVSVGSDGSVVQGFLGHLGFDTTNRSALVSFYGLAEDGFARNYLVLGAADSIAGNSYAEAWISVNTEDPTNQVVNFVMATEARHLTSFDPTGDASSNPIYKFDSLRSIDTANDLAAFRNNFTNKVQIKGDGSIVAARSASEPAAPASGYFTLFAVDNGGGKMVLKVKFPTGAAQVIATEPP